MLVCRYKIKLNNSKILNAITLVSVCNRNPMLDVYRYQPIPHSVYIVIYTNKRISVSAYITLCVVVYTMCVYRYHPISHSV